MLLAGKRALLFGYGDVGKGSAQSLRQEAVIVRIVEVDPICAMQACMDGYEVVSPYKGGLNTGNAKDLDVALLSNTDLVVTATGNTHVCDANILKALKRGAVVCNIGHFDNEIDTAYMRANWRWTRSRTGSIRSIAATAGRLRSCCPRAGWVSAARWASVARDEQFVANQVLRRCTLRTAGRSAAESARADHHRGTAEETRRRGGAIDGGRLRRRRRA
jgi:hypothetical protein